VLLGGEEGGVEARMPLFNPKLHSSSLRLESSGATLQLHIHGCHPQIMSPTKRQAQTDAASH
jgi:hypothetical protein